MKRLLPLLLCLLLLLSACGGGQETEEDTLQLVASTYPVYLFTQAVVQGAEGVEVAQLITEELSCIHDYTLTVTDMKAIEKADVLLLNGAGLEEFMSDALAQTEAAVLSCADGVELLPSIEEEGEEDPHFWMSPLQASAMVGTIAQGLAQLDPGQADLYLSNAAAAQERLEGLAADLSGLSCPYLITFHDGFQYLADSTGLTLLRSIEEEEGSEASAADIREIVALIEEYDIPAIFTEKNGSDSTARAIARETGVAVYQLDMIISGDGSTLEDYIAALEANYAVIQEALS